MSTHPVLERTYSRHRIRRQYAHVAWFYDLWGRLTEDKALDRLLELAEVDDGSAILEVGVGTGRFLAKLAACNPSGRLEGIDLSPDMLRHAQRRLQSTAPTSHLQEADAYHLPFADNSFDLLANTYMLDLLPVSDHPTLLAEFRRVLKPGGKLLLAHFSYGTKGVNRFWYFLARHFPSLLTDCRPVELGAVLSQTGFTVLHHEEISQNTFPSAVLVAERGG